MLAPIIIKRKIVVGSISKSEGKIETFWYTSIHVKANRMWIFLVSNIEDVKAVVTFVNDKGICRHYQATWVNPDIDDPLIKLSIDSQRDLRLATILGVNLKPIDRILDDTLIGDQDIRLELRSQNTTLGRWVFPDAIVAGCMKEINPIKIG